MNLLNNEFKVAALATQPSVFVAQISKWNAYTRPLAIDSVTSSRRAPQQKSQRKSIWLVVDIRAFFHCALVSFGAATFLPFDA